MTRASGGRLSFGLPHGPMVEAPVVLPSCVRPWAFLWNDFDSVALDSRAQGGQRPVAKQSALLAGKDLTSPGPLPLRLRGARSPTPPLGLLPLEARPASKQSYLPTWLLSHRSDSAEPDAGSPPSPPLLRAKARSPASPESTDGASKRWTAARQPKRVTVQTESPERSHASSAEADRGERPPSPGRSPPRSPSMNSPRTSRGRSLVHMWDMVRHVTTVYQDLPKQLKA